METNSRKLIKRLRDDGWELVRIEGSHHQYKNLKTNELVVIPHPRKDLPTGTVHSIYKQAKWKI